ncbi:class I SAM-dependent methyltransferase [Bizionia myxarmorum]|uniref:Class I SAM-dependent methyltransferase n=1 Tax=Bizionia myxarmorum TaxID=291186 RepID=A0A5D0RCM2_9FLAO|nr:class I SAM-dependent methyltransferase [Bizionia myxarmorum]TYB78545.1 class I SAM-dependent methyltransferase [Bizionia myxarmorum]
MTLPIKSHWNTAYIKDDNQLGWFEEDPQETMTLILKTQLPKTAKILNVGAGTTKLIDALLDAGYRNIIANDLSDMALEKLQARIKYSHDYKLPIVVDDLTQPKELESLEPIDLWIDRAVLHFFLKEEEQQAYFNLVKKIVAKNGFVLIAVFATDGAEKCCGLDVQRYNASMLEAKLGSEFELVSSFHHTFINPFGGERPYIYTLFKRL